MLSGLGSPVAALFSALAGVTYGLALYAQTRQVRPLLVGLGVIAAALVPVLALAVAFPEGGTEPFAFSALWPILVIAAALVVALPRDAQTMRAGVALYALGCLTGYVIDTPVGGNAARLGPLLAGPIVALYWRRQTAILLVSALPLLYVQTQAAVRDVATASGDPSTSADYYRPLLAFLDAEPGPPFRIEIPFTRAHWEAYEVAPHIPLARGWERQLDIKYDHLFYGDPLTALTYDGWLHRLAVRFVAVADAPLDYSAVAEARLIDHGLPYLSEVFHSAHWRVYAVADPTPIVTGSATLTTLGPNGLTLHAQRAGDALIRVRFSPYWALAGGHGCVSKAGDFTAVHLTAAGRARLVIRFSPGRIGAGSPRCA
jgi:hypothetical protein